MPLQTEKEKRWIRQLKMPLQTEKEKRWIRQLKMPLQTEKETRWIRQLKMPLQTEKEKRWIRQLKMPLQTEKERLHSFSGGSCWRGKIADRNTMPNLITCTTNALSATLQNGDKYFQHLTSSSSGGAGGRQSESDSLPIFIRHPKISSHISQNQSSGPQNKVRLFLKHALWSVFSHPEPQFILKLMCNFPKEVISFCLKIAHPGVPADK